MSELQGQLSLATGLVIWEGFDLVLPDQTIRFHAGTNENLGSVIWQGNVYTPWPINAVEFGTPSQGAPARPQLQVGNFGGAISELCRQYDDLLWAKLKRHRTLVKYLDAVNFADGNPSANPFEHYPIETWFITRKANETPAAVEFELGSPLDLQGVQLPRRQVVAGTCLWAYRSGECGYAGGPVADYTDNPTSDPSKDQCSRTQRGCKKRFGELGELPFGGFPGIARVPRL
ncbi:phage minor tail protein L [Pseudomonas azerbaijanoccidens]|uniref:phage minor tail protein L n=1 Tax=Pseudomonas azerbaijanoccidentalis TaxID=2842347 RepID=UPI00200A0531|nr:phage minor tail protein L [Pseudomonas azerbaijanoccidentalis]MCK8669305.1 phage minor tail protein L [Pseudomonas azerbaijanoccidentalis]